MDNGKASYEAIEQELNEYKELLWQLSDEYRTNMGSIEQKLKEQTLKASELEEKLQSDVPDHKFSFITSLGLPACVLNDEGLLIRYNNKFKFLIELLGHEIEEISNIAVLLSKNEVENLTEKINEFFKGDDGIFQSLFKVENSFRGIINLILRVYKSDSGHGHLALFVELNKPEIKDLGVEVGQEIKTTGIKESPKPVNGDHEIEQLKLDILIFAEKYELYSELDKLFDERNESIKNLRNKIELIFGLEHTRNKILDKLKGNYKDFVQLIRSKYPDLTPNEEKHCMLIRAGLTYKEISAVMDISINGVKIARNRLRKKLDLENDTKTSEFIDNV